MSEYTTSDEETTPDDVTEPSDVETTDAEEGKSSKDWMVPAALLAGVVLLVAIFGVGFAVGRATGDGETVASDAVVIHVQRPNLDDVLPDDGSGLFDFGRRGPGGRFDLRDLGSIENLDELPGQILDRLCGLLDEGRIPEQVPFADQLAEMCDNASA